ncbi:MAG: segregation/condensation protein A [Microcoleaceae cyanobacterium]
MIVDLSQITPISPNTPFSEGIALLIELAEKGEIDPWDVQVIDVIDRYLSHLTPHSFHSQADDFQNLSQSGQAFLYASVLVWLKADSLASVDPLETSTENFDSDQFADSFNENEQLLQLALPLRLEKQLKRRGVANFPRKRQVTLPELIQQLQLIGATLTEQPTRSKTRRPSSKSIAKAAKAIAELAHEENLVETATDLELFLANQWGEIAQEWLEFQQLLEIWPQAKIKKKHHNYGEDSEDATTEELTNDLEEAEWGFDRVGVFWALLLLSSQSKVELSQEEFYQDLQVKILGLPMQLAIV